MKLLLILAILSSTLNAATLGQYYSSPEATSSQKFVVSDSKLTYEKKSNFFDKKSDYRLGVFETTATKVSKADNQKLKEIAKKIKKIDDFMKKKGESFNDLSTKKPHASFFLLDDYRISQESDLYPEVKEIYERLYEQNWKLKKGIKLSDDFKKLIHIKDGKEVSQETFDFPFHCRKSEPPTICGYKEEGILYVK